MHAGIWNVGGEVAMAAFQSGRQRQAQGGSTTSEHMCSQLISVDRSGAASLCAPAAALQRELILHR